MAQDTEQKIFEAARAIFQERGYHGARMQEIARRAGINQSMLHYYFRTKDSLFEAVFQATAKEVLGPVMAVLREDLPFPEKLDRFVETYLRQIAAHPHAPAFILQELNHHPERLKAFAARMGAGLFERWAADVQAAVARGEIRPIAPAHLLADMLALCAFPFIARPMLQAVTGLNDDAYRAFLAERKDDVLRFLHQALAP